MTLCRRTRIVLLTGFLILAGCGRKTGDISKIKLELDLPSLEYSSLSEPSNLSEFDCFGILLIHPTESQNPNQCQITSSTSAAGSSFRLPYQQFLGGYFKGDPIEFEVANGRDRSLQLVGFKTNFGANIQQAREACSKYSQQRLASFSQLYRLGQSEKFDVLPGATTNVSIRADFTATSSEVVTSCFGAAPPTTAPTAGTPVLAKLTLQDGITTIMQNVCVGGMLELLDAFGNRANVTEDIQIQLSTGNFGSRFYRNFEQCTNSFGENPRTLNFYDGTLRFNHIPIFFKPGSASTDPIILSNISGPATIATMALAINSLNQVSPLDSIDFPRLEIFDSFSNRSTVGALPANPILVKSGICRTAQVQLVGDNKPPHEMLLTGSGSASVTINVIQPGVGVFNFYPNKNCSSGATANTITISIPMVTIKPYVGEFSYIVPTGIAPNFQLTVNLSLFGGANYNGTSVYNLTTNNFFQIVE